MNDTDFILAIDKQRMTASVLIGGLGAQVAADLTRKGYAVQRMVNIRGRLQESRA